MKGKGDGELWEKIAVFSIDEGDVEFRFADRLGRENGWSRQYTDRVIAEYRRFLYLCCRAGHPVTPSEDVDEAWHLHLCYTRSYWDRLCGETLGEPIHHGPTKGGGDERAKFRDWYLRTLESYREHFGDDPPADVWPPADVRFRPREIRKVDPRETLLVPKRRLSAALVLSVGSGLLASCSIGDGIGDDTLIALSVIFFVTLLAYLFGKFGGRGGGGNAGGGGGGMGCGASGGGCSNDSGCGSSGCGSGCGGGCGS